MLDRAAGHAIARPDAAIGVDVELRNDEQADALDARWPAGDFGQHKMNDVRGQVMLAGRDKNLGAGESASGTYYAELNATIPLSDLAGAKDGYASGITGIAHIARQEFSGDKANANQGYKNSDASYTDYKLGLQKAFTNGVNVGAFWSKANTLSKSAGNAVWQYASTGANIGDSTGTIYVQKTF